MGDCDRRLIRDCRGDDLDRDRAGRRQCYATGAYLRGAVRAHSVVLRRARIVVLRATLSHASRRHSRHPCLCHRHRHSTRESRPAGAEHEDKGDQEVCHGPKHGFMDMSCLSVWQGTCWRIVTGRPRRHGAPSQEIGQIRVLDHQGADEQEHAERQERRCHRVGYDWNVNRVTPGETVHLTPP